MNDALRVWLEPGYDHGRTGAWLLDWPGAFCWGPDRAGTLDRVHSAAHRFVEWLAEHGEQVARPPLAEVEVVEEVGAYRLDDGYEVNATFAADSRRVSADQLAAQLRWLGYAREDLDALIGRLADFEAAGGRLPLEDRSSEPLASRADAGRTGDEVLRHVAGAEVWFASRLDGSARYAGPPRDGELRPYLAATREFLIRMLEVLRARDPGATRTDGKGEHWTLAKVLRRALYHSLDHLDELDRRLALAEDRAAGLELRRNAELDGEELRRLFAATGLLRRARDTPEVTARMLAGSTETVSAWDGDRLVGFGRIITDEATNGYISTVAVTPRWQNRGVGERLMAALMEGREALKLTLDARAGAQSFYERLGFRRSDSVTVRPRQHQTRRPELR
ncbi:MAG: GNAT family N-acetyltransferase [Chloroflexota bacterium]|nr:GNAT family N-acetyltransferase [Chloroflexota bacterium]